MRCGRPDSLPSIVLMVLVMIQCQPRSSATEVADANPPRHEVVLKDAKPVEGLIPLFRQGSKLFAELNSRHYEGEYLILISIARGIGQEPLLGGMTWSNGDDGVWVFRKVDDRVLVCRKNVRFRADAGSPAASAVQVAYTDSVLFSLPVVCKGPGGGDLLDVTGIFMSDLPQITAVLGGFYFSADKSQWTEIKGFERNTEIEVAATYASNGNQSFESVADSRGVTLNIHYSISQLPRNGFRPRLADDRVGYFLTVVKDYSKRDDEQDRFVRYINRWDLQKSDPAAEVSPPKKPIIFWLESTIPFAYRQTVREGIEEWNKAFEAAGFANAIEVRQQPDDADWDPEDINYNTFRWITSSAGFAMGPSRVNPYTGQILDADIIFDADFLQHWRQEFETFTPQGIAAITGGPLELSGYVNDASRAGRGIHRHDERCQRQHEIARQLLLGRAAIAMRRDSGLDGHEQEKMIHQGLKGTVMHEVGHTLGLRHNFKGSTMHSLEQLNDVDASRSHGMLSSVMDYDAVNIVPEGQTQGDYFTTTIGPYDRWAIEFGYREVAGDESSALSKIAALSGRPEYAFATDEDTRGIDPDPYSNRWDLGSDPLEFAERQAQLVRQLLPHVVDRMTEDGDDYSKARRAFGALLSTHGQALYFASRFVGGVRISRSHKGDEHGMAPFSVVPAKDQRRALELVEMQIFQDDPFEVPSEVYQHLTTTHWSHWGSDAAFRKDFPIHEVILMWQSRILDQLLSPWTLARLMDTELHLARNEDALTAAELLQRLTAAIFSEVTTLRDSEYSNRRPAISSLRRNLQRTYMKRLATVAMGQAGAPEDCQTISFQQLQQLHDRIEALLDKGWQLDDYTQAHLEETQHRIEKVLESRMIQVAP